MDPDKISILAVDDEPDIRELLQRGLAGAGYRCVTASSFGQAAQLLYRETFALVLLDIMMPGKSGMELLPEIIAQCPDTVVIMMTGVADTATAVKAMREGALDYLSKPFDLNILTTRIEHALARRDLLLQNREYQKNLEGMVAERTAQLEQRVREVTALNRLLQEHLRQDAQAQPPPDLEQVPLLDSGDGRNIN
jgi:DNA-binding NtrC family response regulator